MKKSTLAVIPAVLVVTTAGALFLPPYDGPSWTITGTGVATFAPLGTGLSMIGPDLGVPDQIDVTHPATSTGTWSFNWIYTSLDASSGFDNAYFLLNGQQVFLATASAGQTIAGTLHISVSIGDTIGWRVDSTDGLFGPGLLRIRQFERGP